MLKIILTLLFAAAASPAFAECANQLSTAALFDIGITDANAAVSAAPVDIMVKTPGLVNVEVWTHGAMAVRLTQGSRMFSGSLDLSSEPAGPFT